MYKQMAAVPCQVGPGPKRRLQETLFNTFTPITVHILSAIAVKPQTRTVVTDGTGVGCSLHVQFCPGPRLLCPAPGSVHRKARRHGWRAHLCFPGRLPSLTLRSCHREGELTVPAEILLSSRSTPKSGRQPSTFLPGQACIPATWRGSAGLTLVCGPQ